MTTFRRCAGVAGGVGLVAAVLSAATAGPAIADNVKAVTSFIVNDANNAVPVKNGVNPLRVQTVDDATKGIFSSTANLQFGAFAGACSDIATVVPAGKRLVLEFLSVTAEMNGNDQLALVEIRPSLAGDNRIFAAVVPTFGGAVGSASFRLYGASQPLKLYFDPTGNFTVCAFKTGTTDVAFFDATVSGYYVDLP